MAKTICFLNAKFNNLKEDEAYSLAQTYSLNKGLKKFGEKGKKAAFNEMKQLHDCMVFKPICVEDMTPLECKRGVESLIFLVEKRDGRIKARTCANGSTQREHIDCKEVTSPAGPAAATEAMLITGVINSKQG